jgi:hypothetical protein
MMIDDSDDGGDSVSHESGAALVVTAQKRIA